MLSKKMRPRYMTNRPRPVTLGILLALAALVLAGFYPTLTADFITYDDPFYVYNNPAVRDGLSWATVRWSFTAMHASNWHPLTWLSHALDCQLFGLDARGHHATNLLLHFLNSALVFLLLRQLTGALWRSALVAALFAVHPMHVESVAWISERKDVLSAFFGLLALLAYAKYVTNAECGVLNAERVEKEKGGRGEEGKGSTSNIQHPTSNIQQPTHNPQPTTQHQFSTLPLSLLHPLSSRWYWLALVFFAWGLMSKPMLVTWPFVMLLLDFWPLKRVRSAECGVRNSKAVTSFVIRHSSLLWEKVPFLALAAGSAILTVMAQSSSALALTSDLTLVHRLANSVIAYGWYVGKLFWPVDLAIIYPLFPTRNPLHVMAGAAVLVAFTVLALWQWRRRPYLFTGWFWFVGTLVPVIGLVQVGLQAYADRYTYLPYIGLFLMLAWAGAEWFSVDSGRRKLAVAGGLALVLLATGLTNQQSRHWQDARTVFERALAVTRDNFIAHYSLGQVLAERSDYEGAIGQYEAALAITPQFADAWNYLGYARLAQHRPDLALTAFQRAKAIQPHDLRTRHNVAAMLHETGDHTNALSALQEIVADAPDYADAHFNLANTLVALRQYTNALAHYRRVIALQPDHAAAHLNLGHLLLQLGQSDEARAAYRNALAATPRHPQAKTSLPYAHLGLANVAATENNRGEEARQLELFLAAQPEHAEARTRLALAFVALGRPDDARQQAEETIRRHPNHAPAWQALGVIHEQQGRPGDAIQAYETALRLNPDTPELLNNLAWLLTTSADETIRDGPRAVTLAQRACELTKYGAPMLIGTLAAAQAEAGQFAKAIRTAERAIHLAEQQGNTELAARNRELAERYRAGRTAASPNSQ